MGSHMLSPVVQELGSPHLTSLKLLQGRREAAQVTVIVWSKCWTERRRLGLLQVGENSGSQRRGGREMAERLTRAWRLRGKTSEGRILDQWGMTAHFFLLMCIC